MPSHNDNCLIIFAREPVAGQVKTRLIPALGTQGASFLYQQLLNYTIDMSINTEFFDVILCITPESDTNYFSQMPQSHYFSIAIQQGNDLGARMFNAMALALKKYKKVLLIGTDCPFLNSTDFQKALRKLSQYDMIFSPAYDGGYVLVGAKQIKKEIFSHIAWGTDQVMEQTRNSLINNTLSWCELDKKHDIDTAEDLPYLDTCDFYIQYKK